jgi:hypothetical protein
MDAQKPKTVEEMLEAEHHINEDIQSVIDAYRSVIGDSTKTNVIYASNPITSGKRLYDALKTSGYSCVQDFKAKNPEIYKTQIMGENVDDGIGFAAELRTQNPGSIVIAPVMYHKNNWTEPIYMDMWERVIRTFVKRIAFNENYHYSTGCAEELLIGVREGKEISDRKGNILNPREELQKLGKAINDIATVTGEVHKDLFRIYRKLYGLLN